MRKVVIAILLSTLGGCQSTEPVVITKVVYNITEVPYKKVYTEEAERRANESPADLLDPFFVRLQYYLQIEREISLLADLATLFSIIKIFIRIKPNIVNLGTPKVSLLGMIAAKLTSVPKRIYTCRGFRYEHERGFLKF